MIVRSLLLLFCLFITAVVSASGDILIRATAFNENRQTGDADLGDHRWALVAGGTMQALPDNGANYEGRKYLAARLSYEVDFPAAGNWYIWLHGYGIDHNAASVVVGAIGKPKYKLSNGLFSESPQWVNRSGPNRARIVIDRPGLQTVNVWMREDGFAFDALYFTLDDSYPLVLIQ